MASFEGVNCVSVVIPVYNEERNVPLLAEALVHVLQGLGVPWEAVLVDDGSTDGTAAALDALAQADQRFVAIHLRRNFGQTAAIAAGFDHARGDVVVVMDADLQNDPADIPRLLEKLREGYDVVSGWRKERKDNFWTRVLPSKCANWLISAITGVRLHDYGCSLKAYRREIIQDVRLYGEMHRFLPALCYWAGARIAEIEVAHHPRRYGRSKYGLARITRVLLDLLTVKFLLSYSTMPIRVFGPPGIVSALAGFLLAAYLSYQKLVHHVPLSSRPALMLSVLLMIVGVQFLSLGLLAELIARTYYESQRKKIYTIRSITRRPLAENATETEP